jgi:hypothetical protein
VGRRLFVLLPIALGCRGVFGIDPLPALPDDAGGDDAGADGVVQTYCDTVSPPAELCFDFDRGGAGWVGWENGTQNPDPGEQGGGQLSLDTVLFRSGPASALMTTPAVPTHAGGASATLLKRLLRPVRRIALTFDVRVSSEDYAAGGFATIVAITLGTGGLLLVRDQLGVGYSTGPGSPTFRLEQSFPPGQWRSVTVDLVNEPVDGGPDGSARIAVDGETAARSPLPAALQSAGAPTIILGASALGPVGQFKMNVDNVILRYDER